MIWHCGRDGPVISTPFLNRCIVFVRPEGGGLLCYYLRLLKDSQSYLLVGMKIETGSLKLVSPEA